MTEPTTATSRRFTLVIGNKNYSTWSLRAWLLMRTKEIPFDEILLPLESDEFEQKIRSFSPSGRVPVLIDGEIRVWDSLAIAEYLAETLPDRHLWPQDARARAIARAICAEMHSGFPDLRSDLAMNLRRSPGRVGFGEQTQLEIDRICDIWRECRGQFGGGGPFLFGDFSIADAFYAPVATRFWTYEIELDDISKAYMTSILDTPAFQDWVTGALNEPWIVEADER